MPIVGGRFCLENLKYFKGILTVKRLGRFSFCFFFVFLYPSDCIGKMQNIDCMLH